MTSNSQVPSFLGTDTIGEVLSATEGSATSVSRIFSISSRSSSHCFVSARHGDDYTSGAFVKIQNKSMLFYSYPN